MHTNRIISGCFILSMGIAVQFAYAEGSYQAGLNQPLYGFSESQKAPLYVDVLNDGEVINVALCGDIDASNVRVEIFDPAGNSVLERELESGNVACDDPFTAELTTPIRYVTTTIGSYRLELDNTDFSSGDFDILRRFDISITPDTGTNPDPTIAAGRLWSKEWVFSTGSFAETEATDADYYTLVPGGRLDSNYVWKLDLNKFSGNRYSLIANDLGVDAPSSGYSVEEGGNKVTPKFPIYLGYPIVAEQRPIDPPLVSDFRFIDSDDQDYAISPADTSGVQDSGFFKFTTDVAGTYAITIDTNSDGIFGANDVLLLGNTIGDPDENNEVSWDGRDAANNLISNGTYRAQLQVRLGEYHFIAQDAETSGGPAADGLTIYTANSDGSVGDTFVYWDDATYLGGVTTLPDGALSSTPAGKHTWGDFSSSGFGDKTYIDTYVYGLTTSQIALTAISDSDALLTGIDGSILVPSTGLVGTNIDIMVTDGDLDLLPGVAESISVQSVNDRTGETEQVTLTETGSTTGEFTGSLATMADANAGTNNDGTLNTTDGDTLSITYQDQLDSTGQSSPRTVQHLASLDSDTDGILDSADLDADNDGIPDSIEGDATTDTDADGIPDYLDLDSDSDGINDIIEAGGSDADNDGQIDNFTDTNNDGLDDTLAATPLPITDSNGDGTPDYRDNSSNDGDHDNDGIADVDDLDDDNDGIPDGTEGDGVVDTDSDGIPDSRDLDSDNDGLFDLTESGADSAALDSDNDGRIDDTNTVGNNGLADAVETAADSGEADYDGDSTPDAPRDTDMDNVADFRDLDSDNDGIPDAIEAGGSDPDGDGILGEGVPTVDDNGLPPGGGLIPVDSNSDGTPDNRDLDSDGDGSNDIIEAGGTDIDNDGQVDDFTDTNNDGLDDATVSNPLPLPDSDGDSIPDYRDNDDMDNDGIADTDDLDDDNDGIPDNTEGDGAVDSDSDGIPDSRDLDSDNDGLFDLTESGADSAALDGDNDGRIDDTNTVGNNGLADAVETAADSGEADYDGDSTPDAPRDTDMDNVADFRDLDSDNDGIPDVTEAGGSDPDGDGLRGDGVPNVDPNSGITDSTSLIPRDLDADGMPDHRDLDTDDDGIPDVIEADGQDINADALLDDFTDNNRDGINDVLITAPLSRPDTDNDGADDYRDHDSDNDGVSDLIEAGGVDTDSDGRVDNPVDANSDGFDDRLVGSNSALPLPDQDGDGIADYRDADTTEGVSPLSESRPLKTGLSGIGGCTLSTRTELPVDPTLPLILLISVLYLMRGNVHLFLINCSLIKRNKK